MKNSFDILFALAGLFVFCLPMLIIALLIKVLYNHPVLFYQERVGMNKTIFMIIKFQTMISGKPTKLGMVLRKTGLDELPQFFNVLMGNMSMVGPRALTKADILRLGWEKDFYKPRWDIKPGITGMAQVYGGQNKKTSWFWDKKYISKSGPVLDLGLLAVSFFMNIFGKRRVRRTIWKSRRLN